MYKVLKAYDVPDAVPCAAQFSFWIVCFAVSLVGFGVGVRFHIYVLAVGAFLNDIAETFNVFPFQHVRFMQSHEEVSYLYF